MARRSFHDIDAQARAEERVGVLRHAAEHCRRVDTALAKGVISEETADLTKAHIRAHADEIATGLHVGGNDSSVTRRTVRAMLETAGLLRKSGAASA